MQLTENVGEIQRLVEGKYEFQDKREQRTGGTYLAFCILRLWILRDYYASYDIEYRE